MILVMLVNAVCLCAITGCSGDRDFSIGVYSDTTVTDIAVTFPNAGTWRMGSVGPGGLSTISGIPGPIPDHADLTWTDSSKVVHKQRLKIGPLPARPAASYSGPMRRIFFGIQRGGTAKIIYHDPRYAGNA